MIRLFKNLLFTASVIIVNLDSFGQISLLDKGNDQYKMYEYINAQKTYLRMANSGHKSPEIFMNLGNTYYYNSHFKEALKWYKKLIVSYGGTVESEYFYRYAQTLKSVGNYKESDLYMQTFVKMSPSDNRAQLFLKRHTELEKYKDLQKEYIIKNLSMNSAFRDFGVSYFGEFVVFSSSRKDSKNKKGKDNIHEWNKEPYLDMYTAVIDSINGELDDIKKWENGLNSKLHESTPVFTKDNKTVYFTGNAIENKKFWKKNNDTLKTNKLKIYKSTANKQGKWSKPEELSFCSDLYAVAHPSLNEEETKMYFSSDMLGGKGKSDIYEVDINSDGSFGNPRNLGDIINTEGKETFPFAAAEGKLYFASDGHVGYGGLDLFQVVLRNENDDKIKVVNLGESINSREDDFGFMIHKTLRKGYFSSNRAEGKGKDDIYSFQELEERKEPIEFKMGDDLAKKLQLYPIYFDLDKSFIRPDASIILDKIVAVLQKYPRIKISINSHTDSRASRSYNIKLSNRRASSTRKYIIENGISSDRMISKGFGEKKLVNNCSDNVKCSEADHQLNRRSEFIIIEK